MKKIFVTGATGFVGKNLVKKLACDGLSITCLARNPDPNLFKDHPNVSWVQGDILESPESLAHYLQGQDTVYHLAGLIGYKKSLRNLMFKINVQGTENILRASIQAGVNDFIFMSSVAAIGCSLDDKSILDEESPYNLKGMGFGYFDSKNLAENRLIEISSGSQINTFILNPSTIYGPGDSLKNTRSTQIKVAKGKFPFSPPGGVNVVHIDDVIEACLKVVTFGKKNRRYILASENLYISDVFKIIAKEGGVTSPRYVLPKWILLSLGAVGDMTSLLGMNSSFSLENARIACYFHWFSNKRAKTELGIDFKPSRIAIRDSVRSLLGQV
jgi:dihydroflavonol-4-reductase